MKPQVALCTLLAAVGVSATADHEKRENVVVQTNHLLYEVSLPDFVTARNNRDPSTLNWWSDGCTDSPDNPFGFPFTPACQRHDFGYDNYRDQHRFFKSGKAMIDDNFRDDLMYICDHHSFKWVCKPLARIYYLAVKEAGGPDAKDGKRDLSATTGRTVLQEFDSLVEEYEREIRLARKHRGLSKHPVNIREGLEPIRNRFKQSGLMIDDI